MEIRKFYADDMQDAMRQIKEELGPDAIIISSKVVKQKRGLFGMFSRRVIEVVASYDEQITRQSAAKKAEKPAFTPPPMYATAGAAAYSQAAQTTSGQSAQSSQTTAAQIAEAAQAAQAALQAHAAQNAANLAAQQQSVYAQQAVPAFAAQQGQPGTPGYGAPVQPAQPVQQVQQPQPVQQVTPASFSQYVPPQQPAPYGQAAPGTPVSRPPDQEESKDDELKEIKRMLAQMSEKMDGLAVNAAGRLNEEAVQCYRRLLDQEVEEEVASDLCLRAQEVAARKAVPFAAVLESLIYETIGSPAIIHPTRFGRKIIMVIGPTGVGKTTTLVKLASHMIIKEGLNVAIINSDVYRVGAQEHLKTYCEILGANMVTVYKPEELPDAIEAMGDADVIFVDTAGKVSSDEKYKLEIARMVEAANVDEIYLTVSASTSNKTMKQILDNYAFLNKHRLLLTKLDEVSTRGVILNARAFCSQPLSYVTVGQNVPDDIEVVDVEAVVKELVG